MDGQLMVLTDKYGDFDYALERSVLDGVGAVLTVAESAEYEDALRRCDAVLVSAARITAERIATMENCRVIVSGGAGYDKIDVKAAEAGGIVVANTPNVNTLEVANHTIMLLLAASRKLIPFDRGMREGKWRAVEFGHIGPIHGETLGLVGYGRIGQAVARRAMALGLRVMAYDVYMDELQAQRDGTEIAQSLDDLLHNSDYVSLHVPATESTRHLLGARELGLMKPTAVLINAARGGVVDEAALVNALKERQIAAAGLDVFSEEPLKESDLFELDNVVLTPHMASRSTYSFLLGRRRAAQAVVDVLSGYWPATAVNKPSPPRVPLKNR